MKLSVIIPVYNVEKYLARCIDSIVNQSFKDIEIILVDDGSSDNSVNICDEYAVNDSRIVVIKKDNGGASTARNAGIEIAKGEYITFVDSDDFIEKKAYEEIFQIMQDKQSDADIVNFALKIVGSVEESNKLGCEVKSVRLSEGVDLLKEFFCPNDNMESFSCCTKIYKRELLEGIRFLENRQAEDILFNYQAFSRAKRMLEIDAEYYSYYQRLGSVSWGKLNQKSFDCIYIWNKISELDAQNFDNKYKKDIEFNLQNDNFTLLLRGAAFGFDDRFVNSKDAKKGALKMFRKNAGKIIFSKKVRWQKKIAAMLMYINFNLCGVMAKLYLK